MATDEQQIQELMAEWRRRTLAGDVDGVLALITDDAIFLTPGKPPMTKTEFAAGAREFVGQSGIVVSQEVREIHASGGLAYAWTHIAVATTSPETGERSGRAGHVLTVFRKAADGRWQLARDANLLVAAAPAG